MDFDAVVIGSGPGGYVAAIKLAQLGKKTACIEKDALGGTCLNVGCIPSKSLLQSSELYHKLTHSVEGHGITAKSVSLDYKKMQERKEGVVKTFNGGIAGLFKKNKVTHIQGTASFKDPHTLVVDGKEITAENIIIATGSTPVSLPFLPIDEKGIVSSTGALSFPEIPKNLIVIGAGIIGVELGSVYARIGSNVTVIEYLDKITPTLDGSLSKTLLQSLTKQGLHFELSSKVVGCTKKDGSFEIQVEGGKTFTGDKVLVSIGRRPYTDALQIDKAGIALDEKGRIPINGRFQTSQQHIYAIGDVVDGPMLAHKASEEGIAVAELIAGHTASIEYITIPSVVYTEPEVASVGFTEEELKQRNIAYKSAQFPFKANSRAKCVGEEEGFVKLLCHKDSGHLLGGHIIGAHAGELIQEVAVALQSRMTASELAATSHAHPTLSEATKEAALALVSKPIHI